MILTGFSALNKLLGREVYTSQDQLGGPQVMFPNGVSHEVVQDDQEGVAAIMEWLSFVPKTVDDMVSQVPSTDPVDRPVEFVPTKVRTPLASFVRGTRLSCTLQFPGSV